MDQDSTAVVSFPDGQGLRAPDAGSGGRPPRQRPEKTGAEKRESYLNLALSRGARDEPIETTLARAEVIRRYIEDGAISPAPCSPESSGASR